MLKRVKLVLEKPTAVEKPDWSKLRARASALKEYGLITRARRRREINRLENEELIRKKNFKGTIAKAIRYTIDMAPHMRERGLRILGVLKKPETVDVVIRATRDKEHTVRESAVRALGEFDEPKVIDVLIRAINRDSNLGTRISAGRSLENIVSRAANEKGGNIKELFNMGKEVFVNLDPPKRGITLTAIFLGRIPEEYLKLGAKRGLIMLRRHINLFLYREEDLMKYFKF